VLRALFPVVVALFACQIPGPGWIVALILALLGLLGLGIGLGLGHFDSGDPSDVNPNLGELHTNGPDHTGASVLMVMGHWVCDAGHRYDYGDLFDELHPITMCCITSPVTDCDPTQVILLKKRWQDAVSDATSPATFESQSRKISGAFIPSLMDASPSCLSRANSEVLRGTHDSTLSVRAWRIGG
jgi:hypothetical protein